MALLFCLARDTELLIVLRSLLGMNQFLTNFIEQVNKLFGFVLAKCSNPLIEAISSSFSDLRLNLFSKRR